MAVKSKRTGSSIMGKKDSESCCKQCHSGLPAAPAVYIVNSFSASDTYVKHLKSIIPIQFRGGDSQMESMTLWSDYSTTPELAGQMARIRQVTALQEGRNMASIALCDDTTFGDFSKIKESNWPTNHVTMNIDGLTPDEVASRILKWLFLVLSVRETLYLIPDYQMLETDTYNYPTHAYCAIKDAHKRPKEAKIQLVVLIASKPEVIERNKLTWTVVDRSGTARFFFYYRGPSSQKTWDWVQSFEIGDRRPLPRMPMVLLHEPVVKSVLLSPFRAAGTTVRSVGYAVMGVGRGVHWVGEKVSIRRRAADRYITEAEYIDMKTEINEEKKRKEITKLLKRCSLSRKVYDKIMRDQPGADLRNEKCENRGFFKQAKRKSWDDMSEGDLTSTSTTFDGLESEKVATEFC